MSQIVIGLDLSTKTGYSVFIDGELSTYGLIELGYKVDPKSPKYPANFVDATKDLAIQIFQLVINYSNPTIVIEETCASRNVFAQKKLEFLHYELLQLLKEYPINYLASSKWKSILGITQTKETKKHNKLVKESKAKGKITAKHLSVWKVNAVYKLGFLMKHENEADGINLAAAYLSQHGELKHDYDKPLQSIKDR